jgi:F0F1-type ATP synthase membrane subunit a
MKDLPNGLQNIIELSVESVEKYTDSKVGKLGDNLGSYIFTVAVLWFHVRLLSFLEFVRPLRILPHLHSCCYHLYIN